MTFFLKLLASAVLGYFLNWLFLLRRYKEHDRYPSFRYDREIKEDVSNAVINYIVSFAICGALIYYGIELAAEDAAGFYMISAAVGGIILTVKDIYIDYFKYRI